MKTNNKVLLSAAISGIMLASATGISAQHSGSEETKVKCHGVNDCRGQGACEGVHDDGRKYTCAGGNECRGKGYIKTTKAECDEKGGRSETT